MATSSFIYIYARACARSGTQNHVQPCRCATTKIYVVVCNVCRDVRPTAAKPASQPADEQQPAQPRQRVHTLYKTTRHSRGITRSVCVSVCARSRWFRVNFGGCQRARCATLHILPVYDGRLLICRGTRLGVCRPIHTAHQECVCCCCCCCSCCCIEQRARAHNLIYIFYSFVVAVISIHTHTHTLGLTRARALAHIPYMCERAHERNL